MKRTKQWWSKLTPRERRYIVYFDRNQDKDGEHGGNGYYPDDCSDCPICGFTQYGSGVCLGCLTMYTDIVKKADTKLTSKLAPKLVLDNIIK